MDVNLLSSTSMIHFNYNFEQNTVIFDLCTAQKIKKIVCVKFNLEFLKFSLN